MGKSSVACSFSRWIEPFFVASLRVGWCHTNTTIKNYQISGKITAFTVWLLGHDDFLMRFQKGGGV